MDENRMKKITLIISIAALVLGLFNAFFPIIKKEYFDKADYKFEVYPSITFQHDYGELFPMLSIGVNNVGNADGKIFKVDCKIVSRNRDVKRKYFAKYTIGTDNEYKYFSLDVPKNTKQLANIVFFPRRDEKFEEYKSKLNIARYENFKAPVVIPAIPDISTSIKTTIIPPPGTTVWTPVDTRIGCNYLSDSVFGEVLAFCNNNLSKYSDGEYFIQIDIFEDESKSKLLFQDVFQFYFQSRNILEIQKTFDIYRRPFDMGYFMSDAATFRVISDVELKSIPVKDKEEIINITVD